MTDTPMDLKAMAIELARRINVNAHRDILAALERVAADTREGAAAKCEAIERELRTDGECPHVGARPAALRCAAAIRAGEGGGE